MKKQKALSESNRLKALAGAELTKYIHKELQGLKEQGTNELPRGRAVGVSCPRLSFQNSLS